MTVKDEVMVMTKQEAIAEVKKIFRGNKRFISYCKVMIASTDNFVGIESTDIQKENWNWEKILRLTIQFGFHDEDGTYRNYGFKTINYRKGNKKYAPGKLPSGKHNSTSDIHEFNYYTIKVNKTEEFRWDA